MASMGGMIARPQGTFLGRDEFGVTPPMRAFMEERGLEEAGEVFAPYTVTSEDSLSTAICVPVRKRQEGPWGRIKRAFKGQRGERGHRASPSATVRPSVPPSAHNQRS